MAYSATTVLPLEVGALTRTPPRPASSFSIASRWNASSSNGSVASNWSTSEAAIIDGALRAPGSYADERRRHVGDPGAVAVRLDVGQNVGQNLVGMAAVGAD